jgi:hypothetical protein
MATEITRTEEGEEASDGLNHIDMAMKSVSYCYFQAKASDDKTYNGISSEAWLKCINYLGILKLEKDVTTRPTEEKRDSNI